MRRAAGVVLFVSAGLLAGCATADKRTFGNGGGGSGNGSGSGLQRPDAALGGDDAEPHHPDDAFEFPDAPPNAMQKTLSETPDETLLAVNSAACPDALGDGGTAENRYYRIFDLTAEGVPGAFTVSGVSFQVEDAYAISTQTVDIHVGTFTGTLGGTTFELANLSAPIGSATGVQVPDVDEDRTAMTTPGATVNAPIAASIPAGSKLYVEIDSADGSGDHWFYMGTNKSTETEPGYVHAPDCTDKPTAIKTLTQSPVRNASMLITVTGTY